MAVTFANSTDRFPERIRIWMGGAEIWYRPNATADGMEVDTEYAYLSLGGINIGRIKSEGPVVSTEATFANGLSHVMGSVDWDTGVVNAAYIYGPYGEIVASVGAEQEDHLRRFNGKESDQLSKLSYYGFRYYDEQSLSWTQADPLYLFVPDIGVNSPRTMSLYTFSLNNPVRYIDPDGLQAEDPPIPEGDGHFSSNWDWVSDEGSTEEELNAGFVKEAQRAIRTLNQGIREHEGRGGRRVKITYYRPQVFAGANGGPVDWTIVGDPAYGVKGTFNEALRDLNCAGKTSDPGCLIIAGGGATLLAGLGALAVWAGLGTGAAASSGAILTNRAAGAIIGWANGQAAAGTTIALTANLTAQQVGRMQAQGLNLATVNNLIRQYGSAIAKGGRQTK